MMAEIKKLKNGNVLCIGTDSYLHNYLLYWHIILAELINGYSWLYNNTVYNITRMTSTVSKPR